MDRRPLLRRKTTWIMLPALAAALLLWRCSGEGDPALFEAAAAQAALHQAGTNLRHPDILAPTDGIVISRAVDIGQTVAASLSAPVIFIIAQDLRAMEVHTNIAESDIGRLEARMEATFTVDAYPSEHFRGLEARPDHGAALRVASSRP